MSKSSINKEEVSKFSKLSHDWWNETGELRTLHQINPLRLIYIRSKIIEHFGTFPNKIRILDVGCGGGLVSVPLSRLGADVTGLDASPENINAAKNYAEEKNLSIDYICGTAEEHKSQYDVVLCLEIIEHVIDPASFIESVSKLLKPGGMLILSTINRTIKSYMMAIISAEYLLRWVPRGTHEFNKFVKPSELSNYTNNSGLELKHLQGLGYDIVKMSWTLQEDIDVNYFAYCVK